jgi:ribose-phosphate pyrophosphokinase
MKIFSGSAHKLLAEKIAKELVTDISPIEMFTFPDGERRVRIIDRVVDEDCIIIQPASSPVDIHYMELFFIVDGLKRSGAKSVTAVVPYFGYQRQDHIFRDGEAVSLEVIIKILETVGVDRLISVDLHANRIPDLFHIPVNHLSALPLFANTIRELVQTDLKETVLISPDMGGIARIKKISALLDDMPWAALEKNRDLDNGAIAGDAVGEGSIAGKKIAFIVDDMISSGKTIALAASVLKNAGFEKNFVFATHAVFSEEAPEILQNAVIEKVFVTDTVVIPEKKQFDKLAVFSVADIIAEEIKR